MAKKIKVIDKSTVEEQAEVNIADTTQLDTEKKLTDLEPSSNATEIRISKIEKVLWHDLNELDIRISKLYIVDFALLGLIVLGYAFTIFL